MAADPYTDQVLGEWRFDARASKKNYFIWKRQATIKLHKDHAQMYTNPETFKVQKVFDEVTLTETKQICKATSSEQRYRGLKLTPNTKVEDLIP